VREHWRVVGIVGLAAVAVVALVFVVISEDDPPSPTAADGAAAASPASTPPSTRTAEVTATSTPLALAAPEAAASLYQPVAWDHPTRVNRTPPSSLDEAIKERPVLADGWQFEGTPPPAFDLDLADAEVCPSVPAEGRAQSGDWVLHAGSPAGPGAPPAAGQRRLVLFPIAPDLLRDTADPQMLRIRAVDSANWEATHLVESMQRPTQTGSGTWLYDLVFESPRDTSWMAVVTAGPLWGCFTLEMGRDSVRWPAPGGVSSQWFSDPPTDDVGEEGALRDYTTFDGALSGSESRTCVPLMTADLGPRVRSGEFGLAYANGFGNDVNEGYSPASRASKVIWLPQYQDRLGALTIRGTLSTDRSTGLALGSPAEPVHTYQFVAPGPRSAAVSEAFTLVTAPVLPRPGTWTIVATAAPYNWGCFVLTVGTAEVIAASGGS